MTDALFICSRIQPNDYGNQTILDNMGEDNILLYNVAHYVNSLNRLNQYDYDTLESISRDFSSKPSESTQESRTKENRLFI